MNLGVLRERRDDQAGAEAAYRRADTRGSADGAFNLGALFEQRGDLAGAAAAYNAPISAVMLERRSGSGCCSSGSATIPARLRHTLERRRPIGGRSPSWRGRGRKPCRSG